MYLKRLPPVIRCCLQPLFRDVRSCSHRKPCALVSGYRFHGLGVQSRTLHGGESKPPDTSLFVPVQLRPTETGDTDIGAELTQPLNKSDVLKTLNKFYKRKEMQRLGAENGLDARLFHQAFISFRKYVMETDPLHVDLHIVLNDICCGVGHVDDLFPFFMRHSKQGVPCDLITGEELVFVDPEGRPSAHAACTIEMCSVTAPYEVAVIDEIQMIRDPSRGWAWTRALLGLCAEEIHICGEGAAIDLVTELMFTTGEEVEVRNYERLTPLKILDHALESLDNLRPGDCIVCFNKNDIYSVSRQIEARSLECAVIYGSLPPGTKLAQAKKFNDPSDPCKILVATDAIGMGLNLSIKRIIFNSLVKPNINEKGEKEIDTLSTSQALQIAGRAGRFSSMFKDGEVTTMFRDDLSLLKEIMRKPVAAIETAGLHPTADQIEMFAYHLPDATLANLIDIFVSLSQVDGLYFVCNIDDFKFVADMIQHIPLNLRARYVFCTAPINRKQPFVCTSLLKFARQFSRNEPLTFDWICHHINWPVVSPKTIKDLVHLESVHDILDLYLWLSYRFMDMFPDANLVREIQKELDSIIQMGVYNITKLIRASESPASSSDYSEAQGAHERAIPNLNHNKNSQGQRRPKGSQLVQPLPVNIKGSLASRLVQQGLLTPDMLTQLEKEWQSQQHDNGNRSTPQVLKGKRRKK
ncbi:hypothetical protein XELAEV_18034793mg [Xenopus laevis]|uniref:ATP-dependent RNA helicase SUPV3L1, mitochondrial n=1 Tax=Xenopus laevis TaxID=8355 RepID=A0A974CEJ4_XENLA|nr:hypothetical protein XELAEV_18034793mg [Xenopus laevis]